MRSSWPLPMGFRWTGRPAREDRFRRLRNCSGRHCAFWARDRLTWSQSTCLCRAAPSRRAGQLILRSHERLADADAERILLVQSGPAPSAIASGRSSVELGYALATTASPAGITPALIEVYPHPALLTLLGAAYRVPYKVARASSYWPDLTQVARRRKLTDAWLEIFDALTVTISGANLPLPSLDSIETLATSGLKRYEDALDALLCCWVGMQYVKGQCFPYGDEGAAIWVPIGVDHGDRH